MNKLRHVTWAIVLALCWATAVWADDGDVFLNGTVNVGAHVSDQEDAFGKVGEYISARDLEVGLPHLDLNLDGGTGTTLYHILLMYKDQETKGIDLDVNTNQYLRATASYRSFMHNLDHDLLANMQARETKPNGSPGGKQIYHTDHDPLGQYSIQYERFDSDVEIKLPLLEGGKVYSRFHDQRKHGWKQVMTINHCTFCHVEGNRRRVNEQIRTWRAGVEGSVGKVALSYEYGATDYFDHTRAPTHHYDPAVHPVFGEVGPNPAPDGPDFPYGTEFRSRLIFSNSDQIYNRGATSEKRSHHVAAKLDVTKAHSLRGSFSHTNRNNVWTGVEGKFDAWVASWMAKPGQKTRLSARLLAYKTKVDDYTYNQPGYRAGRGDPEYPGLDFDWTRISSANREVLQADLKAGYRWTKGGYLSASWRHKEIDRDAMTQTQTTYVDEGGELEMIASAAQPNKTTRDRFRLAASKRLGRKGNLRQTFTLTSIDQPFMNPTAMCEEGLNGEDHLLPGQGKVFYFQRQRYGNGTNQPSQSFISNTRGAYQLGARSSLSGYLTYGKEKNDELNVYEFERDFLTAGMNLWAAPSDKLMLTLGYFFSSIESNANLCVPLFDG